MVDEQMRLAGQKIYEEVGSHIKELEDQLAVAKRLKDRKQRENPFGELLCTTPLLAECCFLLRRLLVATEDDLGSAEGDAINGFDRCLIRKNTLVDDNYFFAFDFDGVRLAALAGLPLNSPRLRA